MYLYHITYSDKSIDLFAANDASAKEIFEANFGPNKNPQITMVRLATEDEVRRINYTGAPSPKRKRWFRRRELPWDFGKHFN